MKKLFILYIGVVFSLNVYASPVVQYDAMKAAVMENLENPLAQEILGAKLLMLIGAMRL